MKERDFKISAPATVRAGDVHLDVSNPGPDDHELIIVHERAGRALPLRPDGVTVDEQAVKPDTAVAIEPQVPGTVTKLHVHLTAGRYIMLCNMSGHYRGGMHRTLVVR